jgi:hypothetical protein
MSIRLFMHPLRATSLALGLCGVAIALVAPAPAHAAVLIALDLPALVEQSDLIVVASAHKQSSRYVSKLIVTDVTLKVSSILKGTTKPGEPVVVTHLGGAVGDVGLNVPGAASFKLGESAVVFLRRVPSGEWNVTGMSQGIMQINDEQVLPGASGAELMERDQEGRLVDLKTPRAPRALPQLLSEIQRLVGSR